MSLAGTYNQHLAEADTWLSEARKTSLAVRYERNWIDRADASLAALKMARKALGKIQQVHGLRPVAGETMVDGASYARRLSELADLERYLAQVVGERQEQRRERRRGGLGSQDDRDAMLVYRDGLMARGAPESTTARLLDYQLTLPAPRVERAALRWPHKNLANLGWLLRNWKQVEGFTFTLDVRDGRRWSYDGYMVAHLRDGRTYETRWASGSLMLEWSDRPIFRGLPVLVLLDGQIGRWAGIIGSPEWRARFPATR